MTASFTRKTLLALPLLTLALTVLAPAASAQPNPNANSNANGGNGKSLVRNGRSAFKGNLKTGQHIYYSGDALDISLQFARGADLLLDGEADAHIVIFSFDGSVMTVPVDSAIGMGARRFFPIDAIDLGTLPEGQYQLGLVLTVPGGDPALLDDWYSGFRGLLDTEAVYVSESAFDGDDDSDGEWDDDTDGDGIEGEEDDDDDDDDD
jgi:hypothetical protein